MPNIRPREVLLSLGVVGGCASISHVISPLVSESDLVVIFLMGVVFVAYRARLGVVVLTSVLGVLVFNFFFVSPLHTFAVDDARYVLTFLGMIALGVMVARLTWRVREQARTAEKRQAFLETERLRNSLLSAISHDLRTPVASIVGSSEMLADASITLDEGKRRVLLESVCAEAQRLELLLVNLLEMTRIEGGGLNLKLDWTMPEELIGAALNRLESLVSHRTIQIEMVGEKMSGQWVYVDETSITMAIANLIENAAKFSDSNSPILIRSVCESQRWTVEVLDRGVGLDGVDIQNLFQKFHRGENSQQIVGSGLGLSIVKAVITAHEGEVFASPRSDGGSRFGFRISQENSPDFPSDFESEIRL